MMALDGSHIVLAGGNADNDYWVAGANAEKITEDEDGGNDTLCDGRGRMITCCTCPPISRTTIRIDGCFPQGAKRHEGRKRDCRPPRYANEFRDV
jgi:hypothetical protein